MSSCNNGNSGGGSGGGSRSATQRDLQLRLAPPTGRIEDDSGNNSDSSSASSCVSSDDGSVLVLGGCRTCQRYYMVIKNEFPTCPLCKQPCLIGFHGNEKRGESK